MVWMRQHVDRISSSTDFKSMSLKSQIGSSPDFGWNKPWRTRIFIDQTINLGGAFQLVFFLKISASNSVGRRWFPEYILKSRIPPDKSLKLPKFLDINSMKKTPKNHQQPQLHQAGSLQFAVDADGALNFAVAGGGLRQQLRLRGESTAAAGCFQFRRLGSRKSVRMRMRGERCWGRDVS